MSDTKPERKKRVRTPGEKISDEGDFLVGMVVGIVLSFLCGFIVSMGVSGRNGRAFSFLICCAIIAAALLLAYHLRKRGQRLVLNGRIVSLLFGMLLVGLCTIR